MKEYLSLLLQLLQSITIGLNVAEMILKILSIWSLIKKKTTGLNYLSWLIVQTAFALLKRCDLLGYHVVITYFILLFY